MRVTAQGQFRKRGSNRSGPATGLVPPVGSRGQGRGVAFPKKAERRLECTGMACGAGGCEEAWVLVTDLVADQAEALGEGGRTWDERGSNRRKAAAGSGGARRRRTPAVVW